MVQNKKKSFGQSPKKIVSSVNFAQKIKISFGGLPKKNFVRENPDPRLYPNQYPILHHSRYSQSIGGDISLFAYRQHFVIANTDTADMPIFLIPIPVSPHPCIRRLLSHVYVWWKSFKAKLSWFHGWRSDRCADFRADGIKKKLHFCFIFDSIILF